MSSGNTPILSYHAQHHRVRLELTRAMALSSPLPPPDLAQRAKAKLESVKKENKIAFYEVFEDKLYSTWKALRSADGQPPTLSVSFTFASGSPVIPGLTVVSTGGRKPGVTISTDKPIDMKVIPREWIRASISKLAKDNGIRGGLFQPQLQSAIMRLMSGEVLDKFVVSAASAIPAVPVDGKVYSVMANKGRVEIVVFVGDIAALQSDEAIENLIGVLRRTMGKMKAAGLPPMRMLKSEMISCIRAAMTGLERVGIGMPLAILAAIPVEAPKTAARKFLSFHVTEDKMLASIISFDMKLYNDPEFKMSREFLTEQMLISHLKFGLTDEFYAAIEECFNTRVTLEQKTVANGKPPIMGAEPYLHLVYKDAPENSDPNAVLNIREAQQRSIVQMNQFVAEVRFQTVPEIGANVFGQSLIPAVGAALQVTIGEGIQQKKAGKFYAMFDGLPKYEDGKLTISKIFVHQGDVNLKSGNIYFDGPVEITGNVDVGSLVRVRGPLIIHGSITGGIVISKEPIEVLQSIVTGDNGKVICSTHIKADFIENSRIECDGSITVNRSLVSSEVVAGLYIRTVAPDGVIGGGTIMCRGVVAAANIGFTKGSRTILIVGLDHKVMRRIKLRQKRFDDLTKAQERYKSEFRELAQKKDKQLTPKHKQMKEILKEKMTNVRSLIEKVQALLEKAKSSMTYNAEAMIAASNVFAANCQIEIGGYHVVMEADTIAAAVCAKKRRDTHICTYDEIKNDVENRLGSAPNSAAPSQDSKKAG
ncbi:MAG: FapA family protein [Pseudomonadota bacterium]